MVALIWNKIVFIVEGDYWSARQKLNIPEEAITPWSEYKPGDDLKWVEHFIK